MVDDSEDYTERAQGLAAADLAARGGRKAVEKRAVQADLEFAGIRYKGVGGWLLLLCISLTILSPALTTYNLVTGWDALTAAADTVAGAQTMAVIDVVLSVPLVVFMVLAGVALWLRRPRAVRIARAFLVTMVVYNVVLIFMPYLAGMSSAAIDAMMPDVVVTAIRGFVFSAIWLAYLARSERVKDTYAPPVEAAMAEHARQTAERPGRPRRRRPSRRRSSPRRPPSPAAGIPIPCAATSIAIGTGPPGPPTLPTAVWRPWRHRKHRGLRGPGRRDVTDTESWAQDQPETGSPPAPPEGGGDKTGTREPRGSVLGAFLAVLVVLALAFFSIAAMITMSQAGYDAPPILGAVVSLIAGIWVLADASKLGGKGVTGSPGLWALGVFLAMLFVLPVYVYMRPKYVWRAERLCARRGGPGQAAGLPEALVRDRVQRAEDQIRVRHPHVSARELYDVGREYALLYDSSGSADDRGRALTYMRAAAESDPDLFGSFFAAENLPPFGSLARDPEFQQFTG